jgi:FkbM family methyltransferase
MQDMSIVKTKINNLIYKIKVFIGYYKWINKVRYITHSKYYFKPTYNTTGNWEGYIGSKIHGSYVIRTDILPKNPIMFSFGIGDDIEAERIAIERYNCKVYAFDPTPKTKEYIEIAQVENLYFENIALTNYNGECKLYLPDNEEYISGSVNKENVGWQQLSDKYINVQCCKMSTLMNNLNIDSIDYLKLCVEGCEYDVIENIIEENLNITQIAIAFCGRNLRKNYTKDKKIYNQLINRGYDCLPYIEDDKITFVRRK